MRKRSGITLSRVGSMKPPNLYNGLRREKSRYQVRVLQGAGKLGTMRGRNTRNGHPKPLAKLLLIREGESPSSPIWECSSRVEQVACNYKVEGSIPSISTNSDSTVSSPNRFRTVDPERRQVTVKRGLKIGIKALLIAVAP